MLFFCSLYFGFVYASTMLYKTLFTPFGISGLPDFAVKTNPEYPSTSMLLSFASMKLIFLCSSKAFATSCVIGIIRIPDSVFGVEILKRLYNLFRSRPTQQNFQRKFLEVHRMEFLYLFVVSILVGSPLQHDGQLSSNNFQSDIKLFSGSQTVSSISPPFLYDLKSVYPSFRTI